MGWKLVVVEGKARGSEFPLGGKPILDVGSARTADVPLDDPDVAAAHVKVSASGGELSVFDVSGRGFLHNGKRTLKSALKENDVITLGKHQLKLAPIAAPQPAPAAAPATARGKAELQTLKGNDAGKKFDLTAKDMFIIGRGVATDVTVWDIRVSRVHARIDRDASGWLITDLNASNGTYVNGEKVETRRLKPGDEIKVGSTVLQFVA
jgi:pSer/pThr/pTyr-binding forkhead associated (FHA) protein